MKNSHLVSKLSHARGLGAAKEGVGHWWYQRLTALALVPLGIWFVVSLMLLANTHDPFSVTDWMSGPLNALFTALLMVALFWHAKLGVQVVVEDYVKPKPMKYTLLLLNTFFCFGAAVMSVLAILRLHMFTIVSGL